MDQFILSKEIRINNRDKFSISTERNHNSIEIYKNRKEYDIMEWMEANCYINGKRLSFQSTGPRMELGERDKELTRLLRPYMPRILRDMSDSMAVNKPRQSELTVSHIMKILYYAIVHGCEVGHFFPSDGVATNVSSEKVGPAITTSPEIREFIKQSSVHRYSFIGGGLYALNGVLDRAAGRAPSRDFLIYDEYDQMSETIIPVLQGMMKHSSWRKEIYISTSTVPEIGIDGKVKEGSNEEWKVKCPKCKLNQTFEFPDNIIGYFDVRDLDINNPEYQKKLNKVYIGCSKCGEYIDRNSVYYVETSKWVPEPGKEHLVGHRSSVNLVAAMLPWKTGKEILGTYHRLDSKGFISQFYNEEWGKAYIKGGLRLERSEILQLPMGYKEITARAPMIDKMSMGIDWGEQESWLTIRGKISGFDVKSSILKLVVINDEFLDLMGFKPRPENHVKAVAKLIERYRPEIVVDDANGIGIDRHSWLASQFPGKVFGAFYDTQEKNKSEQTRLLNPVWSDSQKRVTIPKVKLIKDIMMEIRNQDVSLPEMADDRPIELHIKHHVNLGVQSRIDLIKDREFQIWVKFGPEHFFDSDIYAKVGLDRLYGEGSTARSDVPGVA